MPTRSGGRCFAEGAWLSPARWFVDQVMLPNAKAFTVLLILYQATVAALIFTKGGLAAVALIAGAVFSLLAALASSPGGTVGTLPLAVIQDCRYDLPLNGRSHNGNAQRPPPWIGAARPSPPSWSTASPSWRRCLMRRCSRSSPAPSDIAHQPPL